MNKNYDIIYAPIITEKTAMMANENKYAFKVDSRANKTEIKQAIEKIDEENNDIVFSIGAENENEDMADYSIIKANYTLPSGITAHFGVVGPERMDYARIASALKFVVDEMNNLKGDNNEKDSL